MELDLLAKSLSAKNALRHAAAQRTHAADVATRGPKPVGLGSPACRRATRSRFTRHAADASR